MVLGSSPVAITSPSEFAPASSKEFLDIQANIECGFTLKTRTWHDKNIQSIPLLVLFFEKNPFDVKFGRFCSKIVVGIFLSISICVYFYLWERSVCVIFMESLLFDLVVKRAQVYFKDMNELQVVFNNIV